MGQWRYFYGGLKVLSELRLPEWEPFQVPEGTADAGWAPELRIRLGDAHAGGSEPIITPNEYSFRVPGVGGFQIREGREILVAPEPDVRRRQLRPWILGSGWGAACYQRGLLIVHASAVAVEGSAMLFCARSGGGKSTLAAQLGASGFSLISDDLCRIDLRPQGPPMVFPAAPRLKLWNDALGKLGLSGESMEPDHLRDGKFHLPRAGQGSTEALPVGGIYLLEWGEPAIRPIFGLAAFRRFLAAGTWRPRLVESMGRTSGYAQQCMDLVQRVPVREFCRARDLVGAPAALARLTQHWSGEVPGEVPGEVYDEP